MEWEQVLAWVDDDGKTLEEKLATVAPREAFKVGYESAILMVLNHEKQHGHEWVQAMGSQAGHCDDCGMEQE